MVAVVFAGIIIFYTGLRWIDPLISLVIMVVVLYSTWGLLRESLKLSLDAVPSAIEVESVKSELLKYAEILDVYHIHIWAMSTTKNAITAHLIISETLSPTEIADLKKRVRHTLDHLGIQHATLETETKLEQ